MKASPNTVVLFSVDRPISRGMLIRLYYSHTRDFVQKRHGIRHYIFLSYMHFKSHE